MRDHLSCAIGGFALAVVLGASDGARGQTIPAGSTAITSTTKLKVSGCPKSQGSGTTTYALASDGSWSASVGSDALAGTATSANPNGRVWTISYPTDALDEISAGLAQQATAACSSPFTMSSLQASATLKLNKRLTAAKVTLQASFMGDAGGMPRNGTFKASGSGSWGAGTSGGGGSCSGPYGSGCWDY
jgi:hypothetical protein